ncbi:hypothetical protein Tco_0848264 [Tanacetum coccineum]
MMWQHIGLHEWWFVGRWLYLCRKPCFFVESFWKQIGTTWGGGKRECCVQPQFLLGYRRSVPGEQLNHRCCRAVEAARRFDASSSLAMYLAKATIDSLRRGWFDVGLNGYGGLMEDGYIMSKPCCFVTRFGKQIGPQGKRNVCDNLSFYLGDRRSVGEQLNHGVVRLVNFCKRFVIIEGTKCMQIDVCVVGGRLVNVIGCVIVGTASSNGGNECGGLGTDGNKVGGRV